MTAALPAWLDAARRGAAAALPVAGPFAQHVHVLATTGSTNDDVARAAQQGAPQGYTVIAAAQSAGRGRRGATWHSPAAHGLYLSTLLRPDRWAVSRAAPDSPASSLVTLMAGVAVASAIADVCDTRVELKWPNDVMVRDGGPTGGRPAWRKLAGILAEGASDGAVLRSVVLGIGVNVSRSAAPDDVAARMVALDELPGACRDPQVATVERLVTALLTRLREGADLLGQGELDQVRLRWRALAPSVDGTPVRWHHHGVTLTGRARGIDERGALRVGLDDGEERIVHGGEVEWQVEGRPA